MKIFIFLKKCRIGHPYLALLAAVLQNFALAALLQAGRVWLYPVVNKAVGAIVPHVGAGSSAGSHA